MTSPWRQSWKLQHRVVKALVRGEGEKSHVCEALSTILGSERMLYK